MKFILINDYIIKYQDNNENLSILQFFFQNNLDEIPKFCYHEKLSIAGNCRMCLIEDIKSIKPIAACAVNILSGMVLYTNTLKIKKIRESILEFFLINLIIDIF